LKNNGCPKHLRNKDSHHLPENVAERQSTDDLYWTDEKFPSNVLIDLAFDRFKIGEDIFMRQNHALGLGGSSRGENDLNRVRRSDVYWSDGLRRVTRDS